MSAPNFPASLAPRSINLTEGEILFRRDDPVRFVYRVDHGRIDLLRYTEAGKGLVLQRAVAGDLVAEASLFTKRTHCDAVARASSVLTLVKRNDWVRWLVDHPSEMFELTRSIAGEVQKLRGRIEVLGSIKVSDRLDAWTTLGGTFANRSTRDVAGELGVSPEALYRELSIRRKPKDY